MPRRSGYPATVAEVLDPTITFRPGVIAADRRAARSKLWRGSIQERKAKFQSLHDDLCRVYGKTTKLEYGILDGSCSGSSHYRPSTDTITLSGRLSVVTFLHEFAHALGRDEFGACRWSINLFRRSFPRSFAQTTPEGHILRRVNEAPANPGASAEGE